FCQTQTAYRVTVCLAFRPVFFRSPTAPGWLGSPPIAASSMYGCLRPGAAGDRKSVVSGKRVDLGGRRIIKKKKNDTTPSLGRLGLGNPHRHYRLRRCHTA